MTLQPGVGLGFCILIWLELVSIAMQHCGDVVECLGDVILVVDVVCPTDEGLVDRRLRLEVMEESAVEVSICMGVFAVDTMG